MEVGEREDEMIIIFTHEQSFMEKLYWELVSEYYTAWSRVLDAEFMADLNACITDEEIYPVHGLDTDENHLISHPE